MKISETICLDEGFMDTSFRTMGRKVASGAGKVVSGVGKVATGTAGAVAYGAGGILGGAHGAKDSFVGGYHAGRNAVRNWRGSGDYNGNYGDYNGNYGGNNNGLSASIGNGNGNIGNPSGRQPINILVPGGAHNVTPMFKIKKPIRWVHKGAAYTQIAVIFNNFANRSSSGIKLYIAAPENAGKNQPVWEVKTKYKNGRIANGFTRNQAEMVARKILSNAMFNRNHYVISQWKGNAILIHDPYKF